MLEIISLMDYKKTNKILDDEFCFFKCEMFLANSQCKLNIIYSFYIYI